VLHCLERLVWIAEAVELSVTHPAREFTSVLSLADEQIR
jgi:hypothetical protein